MASSSERTEAMRQRRREAGLTRGEFYAHPDDHAEVKKLAEKLNKRRANKRTEP